VKYIRSGGMDPRVLREFRDAVDYVRKTASALQELQERQPNNAIPPQCAPCSPTSVSAAQRSSARRRPRIWILMKLPTEPPGVADLFRAIEDLYQRLGGLFKIRESR
jgi:hypothetical protein